MYFVMVRFFTYILFFAAFYLDFVWNTWNKKMLFIGSISIIPPSPYKMQVCLLILTEFKNAALGLQFYLQH